MSAEKLKYFVNGEYVESKTDKYYTLVNPSTGETTGYAPCCTTVSYTHLTLPTNSLV